MSLLRQALLGLIIAAALGSMAGAAAPQDKTNVVASLPPALAWRQHLERDILPFWERPAALGSPVGNFPTFRCNDGSVYDSRSTCAELRAAPQWISGALDRQYVRMMSRQAYLYAAAYHLTGDAKYLLWARAGVRFILDHAFDPKTGNIVSYWQGGTAFSAPQDRTSQDIAYCLIGLSFYYYVTRDPTVRDPILRIEQFIRNRFFDGRLGLYRLNLGGADADRPDLVAQLDQVNAYMLLLAPLLPQPYQERWRAELTQIARVMRERYFDRGSGLFLGTLARDKPGDECIHRLVDTDFGHSIKAFWMLHFVGRLNRDAGLQKFVQTGAAAVLRKAFRPESGSWGTQPSCPGDPAPRTIAKWWMSAELDQAALSFGIADPALLTYIPATFAFWQQHMVDHAYGEVWDEIALPGDVPQLPKIHLWKNGFHTAEHVLVGYIATAAIRAEPVVLYYAFPGCKLPSELRPYYFEGQLSAHAEAPIPEEPSLCRVTATFSNIR